MVVVLIHHPQQRAECLRGLVVRCRAWALSDREKFVNFATFANFGNWLRSLPFREDGGSLFCRDSCCPGQRETHWAPYANCWERCAYALAGGAWLLPRGYVLHLRDYDTRAGRHIEPLEFDLSAGAWGELPQGGVQDAPDLRYQEWAANAKDLLAPPRRRVIRLAP